MTFHIMHPGPGPHPPEPLPVCFYLSTEILEDDGFEDEYLAELLHDDLVTAIHHHRKTRQEQATAFDEERP